MERPRILLVVAPSRPECIRTARAFEIDVDRNLNRFRLISSLRALMGWNEGTAFVSLGRMFWQDPDHNALYLALSALTRSGHLRPADDHDLAPLRARLPSIALIAATASAGRIQ